MIGGGGCWIALGQYLHDSSKYEYRNFIASLGTFAISIAILAYADRILSKKHFDTTLALFIFFLMVVAIVLSALCVIFYFGYATLIAILGLACALVCWTLIKWNSPEFTDKSDPLVTMGGAINTTPG